MTPRRARRAAATPATTVRKSRAASTSGKLARNAAKDRSSPGGAATNEGSTLFGRPATGTVVTRRRSASRYGTLPARRERGGGGGRGRRRNDHLLETQCDGAERKLGANLHRQPAAVVGEPDPGVGAF